MYFSSINIPCPCKSLLLFPLTQLERFSFAIFKILLVLLGVGPTTKAWSTYRSPVDGFL